jgi:phenylacetaldehyde dehydrogenase
MSISAPNRATNEAGASPTIAGLPEGLAQMAWHVVKPGRLRAGTLWIDCYSVFDPAMPSGGYKESGWDPEMGHNALESYLETKSVVTQLA